MTYGSLALDDTVYEYLLTVSLRESDILRRLREETATFPNPNMQISPDQGQFMAMLVRILQARRIIEVGVFTGYSSLWMADAMPDDGRLVACDVNEEYTNVARRYWREAGLEHKIELRLAPAVETLDALLREDGESRYDLVFLDAIKTEYRDYYERSLRLVRPGGLILIDNVLWSGKVADKRVDDDATCALRELNAFLHRDDRIDINMLPVADGLTLCRKR